MKEKSSYYNFKPYTFKGSGLLEILIGLFFVVIIGVEYGISFYSSWIGLIPIAFFIAMSISGTIQLYYIEVDDKKIKVKNLIMIWFEKTYLKSEISALNYYSRGERKNFREGIKIGLNNDKKEKLYYMTLYPAPFWEKMEEKLKIYEYPPFKKN